ncbi:uncharacterized protein LOC120433696 [Oreochromis aureus]|uniref:uncharacterized protein LOC120433696 n=1 Tax=Oreochromis aureus TaxID=47969 RepID=UPI001954CC08|nr:uncharacterized protein LOC120433696 [Oreochromis aureus]
MILQLNQTALLFIQLLVMLRVFAVKPEENNRVMLAFRGDPVTLTCNISEKNASQISWTNSRSVFQYAIETNRTHSNFSSNKLKINPELPINLIIFSAQPEDEGLYTCSITDPDGLHTITWNLKVSENPEESISSKYFTFILPSAIGFLLCGITLAVFFYRCCTRTPNQDLHHIRTLSFVHYHVQLGGKVVPAQPQSFAVYRTGSTLRDSVHVAILGDGHSVTIPTLK